MNFLPPSIAHIQVLGSSHRRFNLWLPLFLIWPFLLALTLVVLPFLLLAALLFFGLGGIPRFFRSTRHIALISGSFKGLEIDAQKKNSAVKIQFK